MADAISNTSPLLYLYRIAALSWLPQLRNVGMWVSEDIRLRILALAGEKIDVHRKK